MDNHPKILVAVDLQVGTSRVLETAFLMAAPSDARLIVVNVTERATMPATPLTFGPALVGPALVQYDAATLAERLLPELDALRQRSVFARAPQPEFLSAHGSPAEQIVRLAAAQDVDLIVVGTHGRSGIKHLLLGSVAETVVRTAGCPVVVVREKLHNPAWRLPEIEPLCTECAATRAQAHDDTLWCARHSEHHRHAHSYGYSAEGDQRSEAPSSITGTVG